MKIEGKRVVVTGAASGIGRALANARPIPLAAPVTTTLLPSIFIMF